MLLHLFLCAQMASAFVPSTRRPKSLSNLQSSFDEVRHEGASTSQSIFNNIQYTSRSTTAIADTEASTSSRRRIVSGDTLREARSGYAPVSQSTGQVGTFGVIGDATSNHNHPAAASSTNNNYNHGSNQSPRSSAFIPHSSTGAGSASRINPNSPQYRHAPIDYNACKSFVIPQSDLSYFQQVSDNSLQQFNPNSSINGASSDNNRRVTTSNDLGYQPTDYNSSKSFIISQNELSHFQPSATPTTTMYSPSQYISDVDSFGRNNENSKPNTPFVPHSSTGAGGGRMSDASPFYQNGRRGWN